MLAAPFGGLPVFDRFLHLTQRIFYLAEVDLIFVSSRNVPQVYSGLFLFEIVIKSLSKVGASKGLGRVHILIVVSLRVCLASSAFHSARAVRPRVSLFLRSLFLSFRVFGVFGLSSSNIGFLEFWFLTV